MTWNILVVTVLVGCWLNGIYLPIWLIQILFLSSVIPAIVALYQKIKNI